MGLETAPTLVGATPNYPIKYLNFMGSNMSIGYRSFKAFFFLSCKSDSDD